MTVLLGGVIPILPTPFAVGGAVDDIDFSRVIDVAIQSGANGLAMFGMASEYYKLTDSEKKSLTDSVVRHVNKRCPVIISIVSHATDVAVSEAVGAWEAGADALMVLPPFFLAPSSEAILRHIREIAIRVPLPIVIQYAPIQTGRVIDAQAFARLCEELPNITHVKVDLVPSGPTISSLRSNGVRSMVGYMGLHLQEDFRRGVCGVMPTVSVSAAFSELWRLLIDDLPQATELHRELLPLLNFMMQSIEVLIATEKELLVRRGIIRSANCREPAYTLDSIQRSELERHIARLEKWLPKIK